MPRKCTRKTKGNKPKLPKGDEGNSLTEDERIVKLGVFTKDFDFKFQETLEKMEINQIKILKSIETRLHCQLMQLPAVIRNMTLQDFIDRGGTVNSVLSPTVNMDTAPSSLPITGKLAKQISKLNPKILCEVIPEEEEAILCAEKRTVRKTNSKNTVVRKSARQRKTKGNDSFMGPPPSTSRSRMTPAGRQFSTLSWPTPQITPKFDPRLPFTPGMNRDPKPGERILSVSGSPVNNPVDAKTIRPKGKGRVRTLTVNSRAKEELENLIIPNSPTDIKNMRQSHMYRVINLFSNILRQEDEDEIY